MIAAINLTLLLLKRLRWVLAVPVAAASETATWMYDKWFTTKILYSLELL
jgi:hypothetical protein